MYESHRLGREGESFIYYLGQRLGWQVSLPAAVEASYDLAIKRPTDRKWKQVQVKVSSPKRKSRPASVDVRKGNNKAYLDSDYDLLAVYDPATLKVWLIPHKKIEHVACEFRPDMPQWSKYEVHY